MRVNVGSHISSVTKGLKMANASASIGASANAVRSLASNSGTLDGTKRPPFGAKPSRIARLMLMALVPHRVETYLNSDHQFSPMFPLSHLALAPIS